MGRPIHWFALAALTACSAPQSPVPVRGKVDPLVGEWTGEYTSRETGRSGSIVFTLVAGKDTATGDVLMVPNNQESPPAAPRADDATRRSPRLLKISFVHCEGNEVTGWLDPYPDPDTGEKTATTFEGTIKGDKLQGRFISYLELSGVRRVGTWVVTRKKSPTPTG